MPEKELKIIVLKRLREHNNLMISGKGYKNKMRS